MAKNKLDLHIQLGYFILQYAKLGMLEFYFDFMDVYADRSDFEYCEMDMDSTYMVISGSSLEELRPEIREQYQRGLNGFCIDDIDIKPMLYIVGFLTQHAQNDKRTLGLLKLEYQGDEMIGLCSKNNIVHKTKLVGHPASAWLF